MRFRIADEVLERFPTLCIGVVVARGIKPEGAEAATTDLLRQAEAAARLRGQGKDPRQDPALAPWHEAFAALGMSSTRYRTSVEALLQRVLKGAALPGLNPVVNLVNALSLRHMVPIGAHDLSCLSGDLAVGPAGPGSTFVALGSAEREAVDAGEFVYRDEEEVRTRRWVWRQGAGSAVSLASREIIFPIDGWLGVTQDAVRAGQAELAHCLNAMLGAQTWLYWCDRAQPEADLAVGSLGRETVFPREVPRIAPSDPETGPITAAKVPTVGDTATADAMTLPAAPVDAGRRYGGRDAIGALLHRATEQVVVREELEARLRRGDRLRVKFGVDPTSPHMHLGHAVVLRKLRAFQTLGHTICLVIGDFTAQIGDASDKQSMRQMLTEDVVYQNLATYKKQIAMVLDQSQVEWSYNADWLGPLRFKDVVGLAANFTVAQMLERENFSKRYSTGQAIGLQEFLYPLMQGYDSVALHADVEVGGTEQLFNLIAGRTLQRAFGQQPQAVITLPLLLGLDGRKMSKSYGNAIGLEESPGDMYGKVMAFPDDQILTGFELCTEIPLDDLDAMAEQLAGGANPMGLKKRLAWEIARLYHGAEAASAAQDGFEREVQRKERPLDIPSVILPRGDGWPVADLMVTTGLTKSKSEARRKVQEGAVYVDEQRVMVDNMLVNVRDGMVIKLGRKYRVLRLPQ